MQTIERMRARGMALSLLFAAPVAPLYERLGWHRIPIALPAPAARAALGRRASPGGRSRAERDLAAVSALYDAYTEPRSGPTVRDARYWRGQLRTAGTPGEDFRVAERGGAIAAYARAANFAGRVRVLEYARRPDGADALAELLIAQTAAPQSLPIPDARDPELARALEARGFELSPVGDSSALWRGPRRECARADRRPARRDPGPRAARRTRRHRLGHVLAFGSLLIDFARLRLAARSACGLRARTASRSAVSLTRSTLLRTLAGS